MTTIAYQSDKLEQGEFLMARGGLRETEVYTRTCADETGHTRTLSEIHLVFTHTEPFIGFDGISLRRERESNDLLKLYTLAGDPQTQSCGYGWGGGLKCMHACFRTYEDLRTGREPVDCASGLGRWIVVAMHLSICERTRSSLSQAEAEYYEVRGWPWLDQPQDLAESNYLIVKAKASNSTHFNVPIDDLFRKVLWNPGK